MEKLNVIENTIVKENVRRSEKEKELEEKLEKGMKQINEKEASASEELKKTLDVRFFN